MRHSRMLPAVVLLAALCAPGALGATRTYYVRKSGSDSNNGLAPATAFLTITKAVQSTTTADTIIYVGPGTYTEQVDIGSSRAGSSSLPNKLIADAAGAATGDVAGAVVISGSGSLAKGLNLTSTSYWQITGFSFSGQTQYAYYANASSSITVQNCTFTSSMTAAIYHYGGSAATILNNTFLQTATTGTNIGVYYTTGTSRIAGNRFARTGSAYLSTSYRNGVIPGTSANGGNPAGSSGSISYGIMASGDLSNGGDFVIENNVGTDQYIGIYVYEARPNATATVSNNTLAGCYYGVYGTSYRNQGNGNGIAAGGKLRVYDNIVSDSYIAVDGYTHASSKLKVEGLLARNILASSAVGANASLTGSIITGDPLYADPSNGDFTPGAGSPALDAASGNGTATADITGAARPFDGDRNGVATNDLGAYERRAAARTRVLSWMERIPVERRTGVDVP